MAHRTPRNLERVLGHPEYADMIWDPSWGVADHFLPNELKANRVVVYDLLGRLLLQTDIDSEDEIESVLKERLHQGCYLIQYQDGNRLIKSRKLLVN